MSVNLLSFVERKSMNRDSLENALLPIVNPILKAIIKRFDIECEQDGGLLMNSLKDFLGEMLNSAKVAAA